MEIKSTRQFWAVILAFLAAGASWLLIAWRGIEKIIKRRHE
jgi:hypothetical protein